MLDSGESGHRVPRLVYFVLQFNFKDLFALCRVSNGRSKGRERKTHIEIIAAPGNCSQLFSFEFVGDADGVAELWEVVQMSGNIEKSGILH
jgi:hypothetical protein